MTDQADKLQQALKYVTEQATHWKAETKAVQSSSGSDRIKAEANLAAFEALKAALGIITAK